MSGSELPPDRSPSAAPRAAARAGAGIGIAVVVGMHRAGTSAVARALPVLGFDLGPRLMSADVRMNARGFFEDVDIVAQDDALLDALGADWKSVALLADAGHDDARHADAAVAARELLAARVAPTGRFACKDPRMPRLLPFWQRRFRELGLADGYVIAVRHPAAVVASLTARDGLDPRRSAWLWLVHLACSLAYTRGRPRVVVDYDRLLAAPERELARIAGAFGLPAPDPAEPAMIEFRDRFLAADLRHSHFASDDLDPAAWPPLVPEAHALAVRLAAAPATVTDAAGDIAFPPSAADAGDGGIAVPPSAVDAAAGDIDALWQRLQACAQLLDYAGSVERIADGAARNDAEAAGARAHAADLAAVLAVKDADLVAVRTHATATADEAGRYAESLREALTRVEQELAAARDGLGVIGRSRAGRRLLRWLGRSRAPGSR